MQNLILSFFIVLSFQASAKVGSSTPPIKVDGVIVKEKLAPQSLEERMAFLEKTAKDRITPILSELKGEKNLALLVFKKEQVIELWTDGSKKRKIKSYPFQGFSGYLGPKLKQGDKQIPEGIYKTTVLNPNSSYHLSIGLNYPNELDQKIAKASGIKDPGGDIYIHGRNKTVGCVPIGDEWIEELFYVVGKIGLKNTRVLIAPQRLPFIPLEEMGLSKNPFWKSKYASLTAAISEFY